MPATVLAPMKQVLRALLPKRRLRRAVTISVAGTAVGRFIVLAASPLLTRLYAPEDFGVLGVFGALLGILGHAVSLRYELAIPLAEDDARVVNLLALNLVVILLLTSLTGLALGLWGEVITGWFNSEALGPLLWLLPVGLVATGCSRALTYWAIRRQAWGRITRTRISQSTGQIATQIGCGYLALGPFGLLVGHIIGQSAGITTLAVAFHRIEGRLWRAIRVGAMAQAAGRFAKLAAFGTGAALLTSGGLLTPALAAVLYGAEVAGWFLLAQRVVAMPVFFSVAVAQVYLGEAPRLARAGGAGSYALFKATTWRLLVFGVLSLGLVVVAGPQLFALVFGQSWTEAGRFAQFLAFVSLGQLVHGTVSHTLTVFERQDIRLACDALRFGALLLVFFAAHQLTWSPLLTIAVLSVGLSLCHILLFLLTRRMLLAHLRAHA